MNPLTNKGEDKCVHLFSHERGSKVARTAGVAAGALSDNPKASENTGEGMYDRLFLRLSGAMMAAAVAVLMILGTGAAQPAQAQVESVLHSFTGPTSDGYAPAAGLIRDSSGNLYGTTVLGGSSTNCGPYGCGTVFEMVYDSSTSSYTEKVLYSFSGSDGAGPQANLIMDAAGNLYGTTRSGGSLASCGGGNGCGTVFELTKASGYQTEKVLYSFTGYNSITPASSDGAYPLAGLIMDSSGNLYGTTSYGGSSGDGTVFELTQASGYQTEKVLHSFSISDGADPSAGLIRDSSGNLYGTTYAGGSSQDGTVFELVYDSSTNSYAEKVLLRFNGNDGAYPLASLIMDSKGNLYGTTVGGGVNFDPNNPGSGFGTVFELTQASGYQTEKVLYSFAGYNSTTPASSDGANPLAGLLMDSAGNLYGTTSIDGSSSDGTVFELSPDSSSSTGYSEKVIVNFTGANGVKPEAGLTMDSAGNLYGTTRHGGKNGDGTVYGIAPVTLSSTSLSFGSVAVGSTSAAQTVTITNTGTGQFSYSAASISGANAADFTISSNTCSTAVAPGANCTVSVTFTPSTGTAETATLNLSQGGMTQAIGLSGTGSYPTATLSPNLTFPGTLVGTSSAPQTVTLTNTSTDVALAISSISVSTNFTQTSTTCGSSLAAGKSCTIDVVFSPATSGSLTGTLTVTDNTSSGSQTVSLSGTGLTTVQYLQDVMIPQVESLGLNNGQTHSLVKELQDAAKLISEGKINGAIGNLEQFIAEVNDLAGSGILSPTQASTLIGEANSVIKQL